MATLYDENRDYIAKHLGILKPGKTSGLMAASGLNKYQADNMPDNYRTAVRAAAAAADSARRQYKYELEQRGREINPYHGFGWYARREQATRHYNPGEIGVEELVGAEAEPVKHQSILSQLQSEVDSWLENTI